MKRRVGDTVRELACLVVRYHQYYLKILFLSITGGPRLSGTSEASLPGVAVLPALHAPDTPWWKLCYWRSGPRYLPPPPLCWRNLGKASLSTRVGYKSLFPHGAPDLMVRKIGGSIGCFRDCTLSIRRVQRVRLDPPAITGLMRDSLGGHEGSSRDPLCTLQFLFSADYPIRFHSFLTLIIPGWGDGCSI